MDEVFQLKCITANRANFQNNVSSRRTLFSAQDGSLLNYYKH
jgi:hypothetical protein